MTAGSQGYLEVCACEGGGYNVSQEAWGTRKAVRGGVAQSATAAIQLLHTRSTAYSASTHAPTHPLIPCTHLILEVCDAWLDFKYGGPFQAPPPLKCAACLSLMSLTQVCCLLVTHV